jgi:hypothetical protein
MFELFFSFADYIRKYELQRAEGVLLRHLSSVHKVLTQTVPDSAKNDTVREMEIYLRTTIRHIDSSLIEEWERMRSPNYVSPIEQKEPPIPGAEQAKNDLTRDAKSFTSAIRTGIFAFFRGLVNGDYEEALSQLSSARRPNADLWTAGELAQCMDEYYREHECLRLDPEARNIRHTYIVPSEDKKNWKVEQILVDPDGHNDWKAEFLVDLPASNERGEPVVTLCDLGSVAR